MAISISTVEFGGWQNCLQLSNDAASLIVTTQVGPRILSFTAGGGKNHLAVFPESQGVTNAEKWHSLGGHRLWHSPEHMPRTYSPDTRPIAYTTKFDGVHLSQDVEPETGIRKEMTVTLHPDRASVRILHRLTNQGLWPVELAVWPITVLTTGGREVIPQTQRETGLLPNRTMTLWPYARMNDPRVHWGERYIILDQDPANARAFKIGTSNECGWAACFNHGQLFVKSFEHRMGAAYPDGGCSYETYVCGDFLEMESLSPLVTLKPGEHVDHLEQWSLYENVARPGTDEEEIARLLEGRVPRG